MNERTLKNLLALCAAILVVYAGCVVWYVATSPDLRLRCLLTDRNPDSTGIELCGALESDSTLLPRINDRLVRVNRQKTRTFLDFCQRFRDLRSAEILAGGTRQANEDPNYYQRYRLPALVRVGQQRYVEVEFRRPNSESESSTGASQNSTLWRYIPVTSLPMSQIVMTLAWFALQLVVLVLGGIAYWNRPGDNSARMFFIMCAVTIAAFVGGYHWWLIAATPWLNIPFIWCACFVPPITLHFFLTFPGPRRLLQRYPAATGLGLYVPATIGAIALTVIYLLAWHKNGSEVDDSILLQVQDLLEFLRHTVIVSIVASCGYFAAGIGTLIWSYRSNANPIERNQVRWILRAAMFSTIPIAYTIWLAIYDRAGFVLGNGRVPMFLASVAFIAVYSIEMWRQRTLARVLTQGSMYYIADGALMLVFGVVIAFMVISPEFLSVTLSLSQRVAVFFLVVCSVMLMLWVRDRIQQFIGRRLAGDRSRLDKALQRINRATGDLVEPESLAEMMLTTCHDVLHVNRIAIYFARPTRRGWFQLIAVRDANDVPVELDDPELPNLVREGSLHRIPAASRESMSGPQTLLHDLGAELLHPIEADSKIAGLLVLGRKHTGRGFAPEDITFLNALSQIAAVALQSARMHVHMTRLNDELQLKASRIVEQERELKLLRAELNLAAAPKPPVRAKALPNRDESHDLQRESMKGNSPAMLDVLSTIRKVAPTESTVLIRGESGTGKELLARLIHDNSERRSGPMISVHCAALSPGLLESELFGHVRGAFTGADSNRKGRFELANGGTIFLDEIGDISPETQVKLLRVLQERCFEPVGSSRSVTVDTRIITATHRNLEQLIAEGRFREDLYYRLNVVSVGLPPLRDRQQDLVELAVHFLQRAAERSGRPVTRIESDALVALENYSWPGNVRELENVIERAVVLSDGDSIRHRDLAIPANADSVSKKSVISTSPLLIESTVPRSIPQEPGVGHPSGLSPRQLKEAVEKEELQAVLQQCGGNKAEAARSLGMPRSTLYSKLKKYGLS